MVAYNITGRPLSNAFKKQQLFGSIPEEIQVPKPYYLNCTGATFIQKLTQQNIP